MDAGPIVWVIILSLTAILIFFSNLSIFIAVYTSRKLRNLGNIFILCLASSDFLVSVFNVPFTAVSVAYPSIRKTGSTLCDVSGFFEMTILIASVFSVTAINVHRYIYIVYWTKYRDILRKERIIVSILCLWLSAIILSAPPLVHLSKIAYKSGKSHCFVDWKVTPVYTFALILICFLMPIIVMGFCYYRIYKFRQDSRKILQNRLTKQFEANDSKKVVALDKGGSNSNPTDLSSSSEDEQDKAVQTIVTFLNESIDVPGEHRQVEMQDLTRENSTAVEDGRMLSELGDSDVESNKKDEGCITGNETEIKATTHIQIKEVGGKKSTDLPLQPKQRRSRMLSLTSGEQRFENASINMPKNELKKKAMGQKYKGLRPKNDQHLGSRKIEILVEESVSSTVESQPCSSAEYKFQVCSSEITESRERYVVKRRKKRSKEDARLTMMCIIIVAVFFASWFPFVVSMLIESLTTIHIPSAVDRATLLIGYLNSLSNPIIYCYFNKNFRIQLKQLFFKKHVRRTAYLAKESRRKRNKEVATN